MELNNLDSVFAAISDLVEEADALLLSEGIEIDSNIETAQDYVEAVATLLDENDLDEELEETLCLGLAAINGLVEHHGELVEGSYGPKSREYASASNERSRAAKAFRRALDKLTAVHGEGPNRDYSRYDKKGSDELMDKARSKEDSPSSFRMARLDKLIAMQSGKKQSASK